MRLALTVLFLAFIHPATAADGLQGKVMCGYQGWFRAPSDGTNTGWHHYANGKSFEPATCSIELWPDVRELPAASRVPTPFRHPDGSVAEVYSSTDRGAIDLHFQWMREHGIDGVFLQRFATTTRDGRHRAAMDTVLGGVRSAAQETSRHWALMYDLTGLKPGQIDAVIADWKRLQQDFQVSDARKDRAYLRHRDKPLVALWGIGFSDREPMLEEWEKLITFLKEDPAHGGCSIMLGVPTFWRTLNRDAVKDPRLHEILAKADVISPWTIGRYSSPEKAAAYAKETVTADVAWCREKKIDFLPVAFPGFSWHNLSARRGQIAPLDAIPRRGGEFFWSQVRAFHGAGAQMLYVAMFDELDEATAIYKVRQDPPSTPETPFVAEPGVPGDHYLWLTGQAARVFRGELAPGATPPRAQSLDLVAEPQFPIRKHASKMNYTAKVLSPILPVADMDRTIAFYRELFGFSSVVESTHYTLMARGNASLHLAKAPDEALLPAVRAKPSIYLEVQNIAELWAHVSAYKGKYRMRDLFDRDYDMREFHIEDPDGCLVMVGEQIP